MIRRLLAFVLLLAAGYFVLWWTLGEDAFTAHRRSAPEPTVQTPPRPGGIDVQSNREDAPRVTFSMEGEFEVQPTREVALPDGSILLLPTYRLHAEDTRPRPEADNLMEMRGVTVELFRLVREGTEPHAEKSGELTAETVLVEVERDASGRPSIHRDREMDFVGAVFRTLPGSGSTRMELRTARARLRTSDTQAWLRTGDEEPFTLQLLGRQPATLTGRGLSAELPVGDAIGPTVIRVHSEPTLVTADDRTTLSAQGSLEFTERPDQSGTLLLHDDVSMRFALPGSAAPITARGDELRAGIERTRGPTSEQPQALWHWLTLRGAPARIEANRAEVECERVDVLPDTKGALRLLTATGTPTRVTLVAADGTRSTLVSERRVHMLPLADNLHEWIGPLGFPRSALGPRFEELIVFDGRSRVETGERENRLTLSAEEGLTVLRDGRESGSTTVRGVGAVEATLPDGQGSLSGEDGLVLHDAGGGARTALTLGLGRAAAPHFSVRRGPVTIEGHGRCDMRQGTTPGSATVIEVTSPTEDVVVQREEGTLREVRRLEVTLAGGEVRSLEAEGTPCRLDATLQGRRMDGEAARIHSRDGRTFHLIGRGQPARVQDGARGEVFSDTIDLVRLGDEAGLRARGRARLLAEVQRKDGTKLVADLQGRAADMFPWRVPPRALHWHASFLPAPAAAVFAATWRSPHVHLRGGVRVVTTDPAAPGRDNVGIGDELWLNTSENGGTGLLIGRPARVDVAAKDQEAIGRAEVISFENGARELVTLRPAPGHQSSLRLAAAGAATAAAPGGNALGVRELSMYCRGPIVIEERQVRFLGPVRVLGDETAGAEPSLVVLADSMIMHRDAAGAVTSIVAEGSVDLRSPRATGAADFLTLDLERALATLGSRRALASLAVDGDRVFRSSQLEFDYTTHAVRAWYGDAKPPEGR